MKGVRGVGRWGKRHKHMWGLGRRDRTPRDRGAEQLLLRTAYVATWAGRMWGA